MKVENKSKPGYLYRHFDRMGNLLYIGITLKPFLRLVQHRYSRWTEQIAQVTIRRFGSRSAAAKAERVAIHKEHPRFNRCFAPNANPVRPGLPVVLRDFRHYYKIRPESLARKIGIPTEVLLNYEGQKEIGAHCLVQILHWLFSEDVPVRRGRPRKVQTQNPKPTYA